MFGSDIIRIKVKGYLRNITDNEIFEFEERGIKNKDKITKYATWGLFLFVAIPLPGTGAWTGALVASLLDMKRSKALISIFAGVLAAATLVSLICYGFIDFLRFLI